MEVACRDPTSAPKLILRDSLILQENDSLYIANPTAMFAVDARGGAYIPDGGNSRLVSFTPEGLPATVFGRPGDGPGEFRAVSFVTIVDPRFILQSDYRLRRINFYDSSASPLGQVTYNGRLTWGHLSGDSLLLGLADHGSGFGVATVHPLSVIGQAAPRRDSLAVSNRVKLPQEYSEYRMLKTWDDVKPIAWNDTLAVAFGGVEYVVKYRADGSPIDTAYVPVCRRHGSPKALLERWFHTPPRNSAEQADFINHAETNISGLLGLWRLSGGDFLIWNVDSRWDPGRILRGVAQLSIISADFKRACVDTELTAPGSGRVRLTVAGDQVILFDQVVEEGSPVPKVRSVLRRYDIETSACKWLPAVRTPH